MPESPQTSPPLPLHKPFWARSKKAVLAVLFGFILLIPRLRRLRRRVWAWAVVRSVAAILGVPLAWHFARGSGGIKSLLLGGALVAFAALVKARPQTSSVDDTTRELGALVALNGGTFHGGNGSRPVRNATIFVKPERLIVLTKAQAPVMEVPVAQLLEVQVLRASGTAPGTRNEAWDLVLTCGAQGTGTISFRYEGTFAEHLARIAQDTITSVWKRSLPVLPATVKSVSNE
jgi:hypothetical protein